MKPIPLDDRLPGLHEPENLRSWRLTKAAIFGLIALASVVWVVVDQRRASSLRELTKTGRAVQGRVTEVDSRRGGQMMTFSYAFLHDGAEIAVAGRRVGDLNGLAPSGPVTVWYDPANPRRCVTANELSHARFGLTPWLFSAVTVIMMGLAGFQAYKVLQPRRDPELGE